MNFVGGVRCQPHTTYNNTYGVRSTKYASECAVMGMWGRNSRKCSWQKPISQVTTGSGWLNLLMDLVPRGTMVLDQSALVTCTKFAKTLSGSPTIPIFQCPRQLHHLILSNKDVPHSLSVCEAGVLSALNLLLRTLLQYWPI